MGRYVASRVIKLMLKKRIHVAGSRILIMGLTFKENCPDLRNTAVVNIIKELESYGAEIDVYDPWADKNEAQRLYGVVIVDKPNSNLYDAVVFAVAHREFKQITAEDIASYSRKQAIVYDVKNVLQDGLADARL